MSVESIGTQLLQAFDDCHEAALNSETHEQFKARKQAEADETKKEQEFCKASADAEMESLMIQFDALSFAAKQVKEGIAAGDEAKVKEGLAELDNHVDGYWHRIVMSYGTGAIHNYLDSLKW